MILEGLTFKLYTFYATQKKNLALLARYWMVYGVIVAVPAGESKMSCFTFLGYF